MSTLERHAAGVRTVLRIDAAVELVLAIVLSIAAGGLFGSDGWQRPSWLGSPALTVGALGLLVAAIALYGLSSIASPRVLTAVGIANGVTAIGATSWALLDGGLGVEFRILLFATAAGLVALSVAQFRLAGLVEEFR